MLRKGCKGLERGAHPGASGGLRGRRTAGRLEAEVDRDGGGFPPREARQGVSVKGRVSTDACLLLLSPQRTVTTIQLRMSLGVGSYDPSARLPVH